jgi:cell division protein FtsI (penicillin-binding protein 3)
MKNSNKLKLSTLVRIRIWYGLIVFVFVVFGFRLFYLQIIKHSYYKGLATSNQLKQYEIPSERGSIYVNSKTGKTPLVLNEARYTLYADPKFIESPAETSLAIERIIAGNASDYVTHMENNPSRYEILAKLLTRDQSERIIELELKGIGTQPSNYRNYPQGSLASQLLGFVNNEGIGTYGVEQALNEELTGKAGQLRAITDASGVPLAANRENQIINPVAGKDLLLTIDIGMQAELEQLLKQGLKDAKSESGGALILDIKTGAVKAMANYPTYNPAEYYKVEDGDLFTNDLVSSPLEVGSIMKPLTAAAAINENKVSPSTTYYDPSFYNIDNQTVSNIEEDGGAATRSVADILSYSLNTGATWLLMQMGGGEINEKARVTWHDYMVNKFRFSKLTGIEQGYETGGTVPDPVNGFGLNIQYANTSFGQGMTATPLQMGAALAAVLNDGKYMKPHLVEAYIEGDAINKIEPEILVDDVVRPAVSIQIADLMENIVDQNYQAYKMNKPNPDYIVGGKTGTAEVPRPGDQGGGYYSDRFNGTFMGFVGGDTPQYVIVVRVDEPKIFGYAGSQAAAPIFGMLTDMLINNSYVNPRQ